ncbi:MAG: MarR family transcriptional regulator [Caulobacter sp.]|nr:MarR family transcriptional regulator [Caulobacter sp.]
MNDIPFRDTPALDVLGRRGEALAHIDPAALAAAQDFLRVAKHMLGAFARAFAAQGLSPGRYSVLMALDVHRPSLAPSEIADHLGVTRATVTGLIDGLIRDDLVTYTANQSDRRRKAIALTPKGDALIEVAVPAIFRRMTDLVAPLSADELAVAVRLLGKVEAGLAPARSVDARQKARA